MIFYFIEIEKVKNKMNGYDERIINEFPMEISRSDMASTQAGNNIFDKGKRKIIGKKEYKEFHTSYST